jgi:replicative DNA helicase
MSLERSLPFNLEAEYGVLGSLLIDPHAITQITDLLSPEDFYRDAHRLIYAEMLRCTERRVPADYLTLCDALEQQGKLEQVGGAASLASLINEVPTSGHLVHYARIVLRTATLRRLIAVCGQIVAQAYEDGEAEVGTTLEQAEQLIFATSQRYQRLKTAEDAHVQQAIHTYLTWLQQIYAHRGTIRGVPTGFADLDRLLGGLQRSDLVVLAGRPGMGKSSLALSIAYHAARRFHRRIGIVSLEMSQEQVIQRLLAMESGMDQHFLRNGWIEDEEWERLIGAAGRLSEMPIWLSDQAMMTLAGLRNTARRWSLEHGIELLIIDYLQLLLSSHSNGRPPRNREQGVATISRHLKGLARELNIPVVALAQLSRAVENRASKIPQLSDLRESGAIEADSDVVLLIYREDASNSETAHAQTTADVIVAKHRNGAVGTVRLCFEREQTYFHDQEPVLLNNGDGPST